MCSAWVLGFTLTRANWSGAVRPCHCNWHVMSQSPGIMCISCGPSSTWEGLSVWIDQKQPHELRLWWQQCQRQVCSKQMSFFKWIMDLSYLFFNGSWQTCRQCCFVEFRFLQWSYAVAVIDETNLCSIVWNLDVIAMKIFISINLSLLQIIYCKEKCAMGGNIQIL